MKKTFAKLSSTALLLLLVAGCVSSGASEGGGTDTDDPPSDNTGDPPTDDTGDPPTDDTLPDDFLDPEATGTIVISAVSIDSAARSTDNLSGSLNQDNGEFVIGNLSGELNQQQDEVELDNGGLITLSVGTASFSAFYVAEPDGENRTIGIIGLATGEDDLPTAGSVNYDGIAEVTIADDNVLYDLVGNAIIEADFNQSAVTTSISELSGTQVIGLAEPTNVSDVASISFTGSVMTGSTFSGGIPTLESSSVADLSGSEESSLDGAFFGPDADEAAAAFVVDDTAEGTVTVFGAVTAE